MPYSFFSERSLWADYFDEQQIQFAFFSAANAAALQQARRDAVENAGAEEGHSAEEDEEEEVSSPLRSLDPQDQGGIDSAENAEALSNGSQSEDDSEHGSDDDDMYFSAEEGMSDDQDPRARVLSVLELEDLFVEVAPDLSSKQDISRLL
jgi:hypothetical protein